MHLIFYYFFKVNNDIKLILMKRKIAKLSPIIALCLLSIFTPYFVYAANNSPLPSSADAGRIITEDKITPVIPKNEQNIQIPQAGSLEEIPDSIKKIKFTLKTVKIEGMTAFTEDEIKKLYLANIDQEGSLSIAWELANKITTKYQEAGFFLSKAYVPYQKFKNGEIIIKTTEGYFTAVLLPDNMKDSKIIKTYAERLIKSHPANMNKLEEFVLKMNDLPGYSCRAVLAKDDLAKDGVKVVIKNTESKTSAGTISYDNFASRYNGINEVQAGYTTVLAPMNQTSVNASTSVPTNKSTSGSVQHSMVIAPDLKLGVSLSTVKTYPGYTLKDYDINSAANSSGVNLNYQIIRQRLTNLSTRIAFDSINVNSNILNAPLTKDHVRAIRTGFDFEKFDNWQGKNTVSFTLSRGMKVFDASKTGDPYLSRTGAKPNFSKLELSLSRTQELPKNWEAMVFTSGQYSPNTLYSTEQFGYGGQNFGKAYDYSEITGDKGINAGIELRYLGLGVSEKAMVQPYTFYDIGKVKSNYIADSTYSAASAGLGLKFATTWNQTGSLGLAWPLTRKVSEPIYGHNHKSPRFMIQFSQGF